jgi:colanic acid biosynthesis glycosyl transferase WcaI
MKILFINQFFWPDSSATSQQLTDLVTGLVELGNEVSVLCGEGGYAAAASSNAPPVRIYRVKAFRFVRGRVGRVLSYFSFYVSALLRGLTLPRYDVVVSLTTPPLISLLGTLIKTLRGPRHFIWEQDIYPDVAIDLNYFKAGGIADHLTGFFADLSRSHADSVIALGECMKDRLIQRGIEPSKITIAENWASSAAIEPIPRSGDPNELVLLYSGNLGLAHDLDTLTGAIKNLRHDPRFRFLFVGSGGKRKQLADFCTENEVTSVELRPYVSRDRLSESLAAGDIGLVTQHDVCCGSVVPSKVYGILAAGRPVLFIGPRAATPALTIERHQCGWQIDCGDVDGLTQLLLHLARNPHLVHQAGMRARQALLDNYDLPTSIRRIAAIIGNHSDATTPDASQPIGFSPQAGPATHTLLTLTDSSSN